MVYPSCSNICDCYSKHKLPQKELDSKKAKVYSKLKKVFTSPNFHKLTDKHVKETFNIIDEVYFDNFISKYMKQNNINLGLKSSHKLTCTAGQCKWITEHHTGKTNYSLVISAAIIEKVFSKNEKSLKINGLHCLDRLECYISIFEHEITHLLIQLFCPEEGVGTGGHTKTFRHIVNNMYGHTEYKHDLLSGDAVTVENNIKYFKDNIEIGDTIVAQYKDKTFTGEVLKLGGKSVTIHDNVSNKRYNISYGIISKLIKNPESKMKQDKTKEPTSNLDHNLKIGSKVQVKIRGRVEDGTIIKINPTKVKIQLDNGEKWNVPYSLLL